MTPNGRENDSEREREWLDWLCIEVRGARMCHMWVELWCTWLEPWPSGICAPSIVGCFGVHEDDFRDVTGESDGELVKADFRRNRQVSY